MVYKITNGIQPIQDMLEKKISMNIQNKAVPVHNTVNKYQREADILRDLLLRRLISLESVDKRIEDLKFAASAEGLTVV